MTDISNFADGVTGFYKKTSVEQLLLIAWFTEYHLSKPQFDGAHLRNCFRSVGLDAPDMSVYLPRLANKKPPQLVREKGLYRLAGPTRRIFDKHFGNDNVQIAVVKILADLPLRIPDLAERTYLKETLSCYKAGAFRATTVMAWNLAYDHLTKWATSTPERLIALNDGVARKLQGKAPTITSQSDLSNMLERTVIECCQVGGLVDKNQTEILLEKLKRRNAAAHPSDLKIGQHQANDTITDLVENIVLRL